MIGTTHEELPKGIEYVKPGILDVKITNIEYKAEEKPYFEVEFQVVGDENNGKQTERFYVTPKALALNMNKFYEIVRAILGNEKAGSITAENVEQYIQKVKPMIVGKPYTQKFGGQEYINNKGEQRVKPTIPLSSRNDKNTKPTIATAIKDKAILTFDENRDIKRLEKKEVEATQDAPSWEGA